MGFNRLIVHAVKKVSVSLFRDPSNRFGRMSSDLISGVREVLARWLDTRGNSMAPSPVIPRF